MVVDAQRFREVVSDTGYTAYDHGINEIYVPGAAEDEGTEKLQFPVTSCVWREAGSRAGTAVDPPEALQTIESEVLPLYP